MSPPLLADVIIPAPMVMYFLGVFLFPVTILALGAEFGVICWINREHPSKARLFGSFLLANLASTLAGILCLFIPWIPTGFEHSGKTFERTPYYYKVEALTLLGTYLLSILIEYIVYILLPSSWRPRKPFVVSCLGNSASYLIFAVLLVPSILKNI